MCLHCIHCIAPVPPWWKSPHLHLPDDKSLGLRGERTAAKRVHDLCFLRELARRHDVLNALFFFIRANGIIEFYIRTVTANESNTWLCFNDLPHSYCGLLMGLFTVNLHSNICVLPCNYWIVWIIIVCILWITIVWVSCVPCKTLRVIHPRMITHLATKLSCTQM